MTAAHAPPPAGYVRLALPGALVVVQEAHADAVQSAMQRATLHDWAARHPQRRAMQGRLPAYAVPLPDHGARIVVRHARHGGLLAGITGDVFIGMTRAPHELAVALRLARAGVPTPEVVAYALYPAGPMLHRADVATREVEASCDLAAFLREVRDEQTRARAFDAMNSLLDQLARAGARHPDLNLRNVLLREEAGGALRAWVIDVDRIVFHPAGDAAVATANLARLLRSARKMRERHGLPVSERELAALGASERAA